MPLELSSTAMAEKNKQANADSVWLIALEITIPGQEDPVRVVNDTQDHTWRGELWQKFSFEIDEIDSGTKGEVPQVEIRVSNVGQALETHLQDYDLFCKQYGYAPISLKLYVLNTADLASGQPCSEHEFILKQPKSNAHWVTFVLSASNPYMRRFPQARILKNHCRFTFRGLRCGYFGLEATCNRTLTRCRELGNSTRFGGFPAAGTGGLNV
jgi:phage-related protein